MRGNFSKIKTLAIILNDMGTSLDCTFSVLSESLSRQEYIPNNDVMFYCLALRMDMEYRGKTKSTFA